jgi:Ca-activated chloride channel family protein
MSRVIVAGIVKARAIRSLVVMLCLGLLVASSLAGSDDPYGTVVKQLEKDYHAKRTKIPFLGLGNFVLKFWHPAGVKNVKVAVFQDQQFYDEKGGKLDTVLQKATGSDWHPMLREFSRRDSHWTYIYYTDPEKDTKVLVVTVDQHNAVVAEVKFEPAKLLEFIQNPTMGRALASDIWRQSGTFDPGYAGNRTDVRPPDEPSDGIPVTAETDLPRTAPGLREKPVLQRGDKPDSLKYREASSAEAEAEPDKSIKLEARLVNLNVSAVDKTGRAVAGLNKDDFSVFENGNRQEIAFFEANSTPLSVMVLLDLSGSTEHKIKLMRRTASKFIDSFLPSDRVAVACFTRRFQLISDFTTDHKLLKHRIDDMKNRGGGTAYYDAMWTALDRLDRAGNSRKALVVITDGVDNYLQNPKKWPTQHTFEDLLDRVTEDDVTVYPIYLDTEAEEMGKHFRIDTHRQYETARGQILSVADQTGGAVIPAAEDKQLEAAYKTVAAELHTLYSLAYAPADLKRDGKWRKIEVQTNRPGVTVKARRGFTDK